MVQKQGRTYPYYDVCANGPFYAIWKVTKAGARSIGTYSSTELVPTLKKLKHPITTDTQTLADALSEHGINATHVPS